MRTSPSGILKAAGAADAAIGVWLLFAAAYERSGICSEGGLCWLSKAISLPHVVDNTQQQVAVFASARCLLLAAGVAATAIACAYARRTPREFLLKSSDPRLVAVLPQLFGDGAAINRNAKAADIFELHRQVARSLECPGWVKTYISVWVEGLPLRSIQTLPTIAELRLSSAAELARQYHRDGSAPQVLARRFWPIAGLFSIVCGVWCLLQPGVFSGDMVLRPWRRVLLLHAAATSFGEAGLLFWMTLFGDAVRRRGMLAGVVALDVTSSTMTWLGK